MGAGQAQRIHPGAATRVIAALSTIWLEEITTPPSLFASL
jgi:hypothetical protein